MINQGLINQYLRQHPYPLLFVTMSGAHLYGFESPDSDYDLRGAHITPVRALSALDPPSETHEVMDKNAPIEIDLVTHDIRKFFTLLLKNNGYVLEQVMSPICVWATPEFQELKALAPRCITRHHHHHFKNFSQNQWDIVTKNGRPTVKGLLYAFRVLLAGIHLMKTHEVQSNLRRLNEHFKLRYIDDLIARKIAGPEKGSIGASELKTFEAEFHRLRNLLDEAREQSTLPDVPSCRDEINELLVRLRLKHL